MFDEYVRSLSRHFLSNFPIKELIYDPRIKDWDVQEQVINATIRHVRNIQLPTRIAYQQAFVKFLIRTVESDNGLVNDCVYDALGELIVRQDASDKCYKHYVTDSAVISLCEHVQIISDGTTGLTSWQAALVLAEWCLANRKRLENQVIVELGAGVGLVGLTALLNCAPAEVVLTDCHARVLDTLCDNIRLNLRELQCESLPRSSAKCLLRERVADSVINVVENSWGSAEEPYLADSLRTKLLLAADVVYDASLFPLLIESIGRFLQDEEAQMILVCTERNPETLAEFLTLLGAQYSVIEGRVPEQKQFAWSTATPIRLFTVTRK